MPVKHAEPHANMADRLADRGAIEYGTQVFAAAAEIEKLRHDPWELFMRALDQAASDSKASPQVMGTRGPLSVSQST